ncbi:Glyoxalase/bleomycin resistance protein/dioxygenase [Haloterrigena turkmenica DSM 5511]|uniref:Glyoxalase/bleomycin resistance protein/dioxygenase n=1 Tax=Haloterrigena turkmenica (strain ATCC 51198 / DSM 5511 / JCM 9101 / NCIMB 13204 / VKM B-1734 / 4k) TaxID=543526 RepID=D2RR08_HALTV|nr:VOC family protein [Haloterrigena turkmenica]ADB62404.1 Glyoxalase/bleomycin resistance protein/dioxygenase [Haloterrigena turkmenica DSM 5511]
MSDSRDLLPAATRFGRSVLTVSDESAVVDFYRDVIGLSVLTRDESTTVLGAGDAALLELRHAPDARPRPTDATGLFHNAFLVPSREALGDGLARIRDRWELTGASDHGVSEALYLDDPEGNGVELYRDRPRSEWPRDGEGGIQIGSWPLDLESVAAAGDADDGDGEAGDTVPDGTILGHVHLEVSSLETAREFYVDALGFDVKTATPKALFVAAGGYHHHLGINTWNGRSSPAPADIRGLSRFDLVVPSSEALEGIRERLEDAGVAVDERGDGLECRDPDGIRIRFRA